MSQKLKEWASCPVEELTVEMVLSDKSPMPSVPKEVIQGMVHRALKAIAPTHQPIVSRDGIHFDGIYPDFFER